MGGISGFGGFTKPSTSGTTAQPAVPIGYTSQPTASPISPTVQLPPTPTLPTAPTVPQIPTFQSQYLPQFGTILSNLQSLFQSGGLQNLSPTVLDALKRISDAEMGAVQLAGQEGRDKLTSQLYSQFGQQTPSGSDPTTGLADQVGARFEYGQDQLARQVAADAAQRELDAMQFGSQQALQNLQTQGGLAGTAAGIESGNYQNQINALLGQGSLANQAYGIQSGNILSQFGQESQNALGAAGLNQSFLTSLLGLFGNLIPQLGGTSGGTASGGGTLGGGGGISPYGGPSGGIYSNPNTGPYTQVPPTSYPGTTNQTQLMQSFMQMLMTLFQSMGG